MKNSLALLLTQAALLRTTIEQFCHVCICLFPPRRFLQWGNGKNSEKGEKTGKLKKSGARFKFPPPGSTRKQGKLCLEYIIKAFILTTCLNKEVVEIYLCSGFNKVVFLALTAWKIGPMVEPISTPQDSPLSKRVADWDEDGLAFNYGIIWGRICAR